MMTTGVIIARFQTPYLHEGHLDLIENVKAKHNRTIIILGVSPITGSRKNPYDYYTREMMIKAQYGEIVVLPLSDHPHDEEWSSQLDSLLSNTFPGSHFVLYGSRDSFISFYSGKLQTQELPEHGEYNATTLREQYADKVFESKDFRAGILYAVHNQYTKVYPTVDIAVFKENKSKILLGKKSTTDKWRFIGGFVDPEDSSYEAAAKRELREEAGVLEISEMTYETSQKINDWRYKSESDKIITTLYSCDYLSGETKAEDDIVDLAWFLVTDLQEMMAQNQISNEHLDLVSIIYAKYQTN